MIKSGLKSKSKYIDSFLKKEPKVLKKIEEMVEATDELKIKQHLYYNLLRLTSDVETFKTELIDHLSEDTELARMIVNKAKRGFKNLNSKIFVNKNLSKRDVQESIQRIGYTAINNELHNHYAKQYVELFKQRREKEMKYLIKKSLRMAFLSLELARLVAYKDTSSVFFAAMNYFVADMVLYLRDEKKYNEYKAKLEKGLDEKTAELVCLRFDRGELAAKILEKWSMPEHIIDVVAHKENPEEIRNCNQELDRVLKFANYILKAMENKKSSPSSIWNLAQEYLSMFGMEVGLKAWQESVKKIFFKVLETETLLFNS